MMASRLRTSEAIHPGSDRPLTTFGGVIGGEIHGQIGDLFKNPARSNFSKFPGNILINAAFDRAVSNIQVGGKR
jgi:hypothetical protein